ncbi:MAG TPA: hypothetical protein VF342_08515 [Alphaproteobacteria bacterium]
MNRALRPAFVSALLAGALLVSTPALAGCPSGFTWLGGYLCGATNISPSACASYGGRYIKSRIAGSPDQCQVTMDSGGSSQGASPGGTFDGGSVGSYLGGSAGGGNKAAAVLGLAGLFLGLVATAMDESEGSAPSYSSADEDYRENYREDVRNSDWYRELQAELAAKNAELSVQTNDLQDFIRSSRRNRTAASGVAGDRCRGYPATSAGISQCHADIALALEERAAACTEDSCRTTLLRAAAAARCTADSRAGPQDLEQVAKGCVERHTKPQSQLAAATAGPFPCPAKPKTRAEIAACYRNIQNEMERNAASCADSAAGMASMTPMGAPRAGGGTTTGQAGAFEACRELNQRGAAYAACVAEGIVRPGAQYNPLVKACAEKTGFVGGQALVAGIEAPADRARPKAPPPPAPSRPIRSPSYGQGSTITGSVE